MTTQFQLDTAGLAAQLTGPVFTPDDPGYSDEVFGFNVAHTARPAVAVGASDARDVAAAVRWAAANRMRVSVQATGHGRVDDSNGDVLISTRRLTGVEIDSVARTARIGSGVRWRAVIDAAAEFGLAPLNGSASSVGVVGYSLGGGVGPLGRKYGFAADHVRSLTVVTADGQLRRVDDAHDADLFWALRGAKIGFGVVTEIVVELVPVARFYGGGLFFPGADAAAVLHAWRQWAPALPDEVTTSVALLRLPPDPQLPPMLQGQFVAHLRYAHLGDAAAAEQVLAPMRDVAPLLLDTMADLPYAAVDAVHLDPTSPMPCMDYGLTLNALPAAAVDALVAADGADSDSTLALAEVRLLGGQLAAQPATPNAVRGRSAAFSVYLLGVPAGPAADLVPLHLDRVADALAPWRDGALPNFLGHAKPGELGRLWAAADRARLRLIARRHDHGDIFGGAACYA